MLLRQLMKPISPSPRRPRPGRAARCRPELQALEDRALPATVFWVNPAGGDWATPDNWSTGTLPGPDDDIVIVVPTDITVTHTTGTHSVRSLTSAEVIVLSGGSLALADASVAQNTFILTNGTLTGAGEVTLNDLFVWSGGTLRGPGRTVANNGLTVSGDAVKALDGRTLENAGTALLTGSGNVTASGGVANFSAPGEVVLPPVLLSGGRSPAPAWCG